MAALSKAASVARARDETRQRKSQELRRLLSPGLSERLAGPSTDEWSSSISAVSAVFADTLAFHDEALVSGFADLGLIPDAAT